MTMIAYLNGGHDGYTTFFDSYNTDVWYKCHPEQGMIIIHDHNILHEGSELTYGQKYIIRSDIMCTEEDVYNKLGKRSDQEEIEE